MDDIDLEIELEKTYVAIEVDKLARSNIKQIVVSLPYLLDLQCFDDNKNVLHNKELFNCLKSKDIAKAQKLNKIYMTRIWNLLDENVKANMNLDDFIN